MDYSIREAAAILSCSQDTIRRRIKDQTLNAFLDDRGRYRVRLKDESESETPLRIEVDRLRAEMKRLRTVNSQLVATTSRLSRVIDRLTDANG